MVAAWWRSVARTNDVVSKRGGPQIKRDSPKYPTGIWQDQN